jgi:hypothetical protein
MERSITFRWSSSTGDREEEKVGQGQPDKEEIDANDGREIAVVRESQKISTRGMCEKGGSREGREGREKKNRIGRG